MRCGQHGRAPDGGRTTAQAQPEAAEQPAEQTAESETTAEQGEEPAAAENPAEPAQNTAEEPDPLVPGRAEDAEPDTTESTETAETAQENSPVILQQETPELAAQDPLAAPEETDAAENDLSGRTPEGSMLLTDEQIRKALDEGALDEPRHSASTWATRTASSAGCGTGCSAKRTTRRNTPAG